MKKIYKIWLAALLLCCIHTAYGKDSYLRGYDADHKNYFFRVHAPDQSWQLGFAAGCSWYAATLARPDDFRNGQSLTPATNHLYAGVSSEKYFFNMHLAFATGLYFSQLNAYLFGWPNDKGNTYIVDREDDEAVHYTAISNVRTTSRYCSIPVELSCALYNKPALGFYLKGSAMASINVHTATSLAIEKVSIPENTQKWMLSYFTGKESFLINAVAGAGVRWGEYGSPNFRIELGLPFMLVNSDVVYLNVSSGFTARMALYVPLFFFYNQ
jgi:hypothetical protein